MLRSNATRKLAELFSDFGKVNRKKAAPTVQVVFSSDWQI
jgi:hypothetical protein